MTEVVEIRVVIIEMKKNLVMKHIERFKAAITRSFIK